MHKSTKSVESTHGIFNFKSTNRRTKAFLHGLDVFVSIFVVSPLVIKYWHVTWIYIENIVIDFQINVWISLLSSVIMHTIIAMLRDYFYETFDDYKLKDNSKIAIYSRRITTKLYAYVFSFICITHWMSAWTLLNIYNGIEIANVIVFTLISIIGLMFLKSIRNLSAVPFVILCDCKDVAFGFPTRFKKKATNEPGMFLLDCFFSVLIIGTLVVFVWRGMWVLCDLLIYPEDRVMSAWGSMVIGYGVVALTFGFQSLIRWACDNLKGWFRIILADLYLFLSFIGSVNVWRGIWMVTDEYFMTDNKLLGDILTHSISFILLALLNCANSILVRGVYIDAEEPAGQCVIFPIYYIRLFFQKERIKKQQRLLDALDKYDPQNKMSLLPTSEKKPTIVSSSNNVHGNDVKAIELQAILNTNVQNVDETKSEDEQNVINQLNKNVIS